MDRTWTVTCMATVQMLSLARAPVSQMAFTLNRSEVEVDRALWALTGRTVPDAHALMNCPTLVPLRAAG